MSRGMWTKCIALCDGEEKLFYYNSTKNISVWNPPPNDIVHDAVNFKDQLIQNVTENNTISNTNDVTDTIIKSNDDNVSVPQIVYDDDRVANTRNSFVSIRKDHQDLNSISAAKILEDTM